MENKEIEKYIFDPNNPNKCKAYKLLVKIAKQKPPVFFSPNILRYLIGEKFLSVSIKEELWDIPNNYEDLSILDKFELYKKQYSQKELEEFVDKLLDNEKVFFKISKYSFIGKFIKLDLIASNYLYYEYYDVHEYKNIIKKLLLKKDNYIVSPKSYTMNSDLEHTIFFTDKLYDFLKFDIEKSSIVITLLENAEDFYKENKNSNIKPIFLKKLDDLELLLNVLENDLKHSNQKNSNEKIELIDSFKIENFYSIKEVDISLNGNKEVYIVGENGDGKSLLLQALAIGLVGVNEGEVFDLVKSQKDFKIEVKDTSNNVYDSKNNYYQYLLAYGASRYSFCQIKEDKSGYLSLFSSSYDLTDPIEWLKYLDHKEKSENSTISVEKIKEILIDILNKDIDIKVSADSVEFIEKGSSVAFEQLSSGYRGVITIVCDIISKMYQKEPNISRVSDFGGVVLIDEVDLHLHPKWKYRFIKKLRAIFPNIQFIVTTHSLSVILGATKEALFLRTKKIDSKIVLKKIEDIAIDYVADIQKSIFDFDINIAKIEEPKDQSKAKKALLDIINEVEDKK